MLGKSYKLEKIYTMPQTYTKKGRGYYQISGKIRLGKVLRILALDRTYYGSISIYDKNERIYIFTFTPMDHSYCYTNFLSFWEKMRYVKKIEFSYFYHIEDIHIFL